MPRIEIETPSSGTFGTVVKMDGREVPDVRSIRVNLRYDDVMTAEMEVLATEKFTFDAQADLSVTLIAAEGCELIETTNHKGDRSYRVIKQQ